MAIASKIVKLPSRGGRWLAAVAAVICIGSDVGYFATGSAQQGLRLAPLFALIILAFWLAFWAPRIDISPTDVTVVNPFRTYRIPWSALESVENRWVLVLVTSECSNLRLGRSASTQRRLRHRGSTRLLRPARLRGRATVRAAERARRCRRSGGAADLPAACRARARRRYGCREHRHFAHPRVDAGRPWGAARRIDRHAVAALASCRYDDARRIDLHLAEGCRCAQHRMK